MPEISRFYGIIIRMFHDDHAPPHFHAFYGEYEVVIRILDLSVSKGEIPPRALGLVIEWASQHKSELLKEWDLARSEKPLFRIEPLS